MKKHAIRNGEGERGDSRGSDAERERESTRTPALHSTKRERGKGSITRLQLGGRSEGAEQADGEEMRRAIIDGPPAIRHEGKQITGSVFLGHSWRKPCFNSRTAEERGLCPYCLTTL